MSLRRQIQAWEGCRWRMPLLLSRAAFFFLVSFPVALT